MEIGIKMSGGQTDTGAKRDIAGAGLNHRSRNAQDAETARAMFAGAAHIRLTTVFRCGIWRPGGEAGPFAETAAAGAGPAAYRRRAGPSRAVRINSGISSGSGRRRLCPVRRRGTRSLGAKAFLGAKPFQGRTGRTLPRLHRDPFRTLPKKGGRLPGPRLHPAKAGGSALLPFARNPV